MNISNLIGRVAFAMDNHRRIVKFGLDCFWWEMKIFYAGNPSRFHSSLFIWEFRSSSLQFNTFKLILDEFPKVNFPVRCYHPTHNFKRVAPLHFGSYSQTKMLSFSWSQTSFWFSTAKRRAPPFPILHWIKFMRWCERQFWSSLKIIMSMGCWGLIISFGEWIFYVICNK